MKQKQQLTQDKYIINQRKTKINVNIFFLKSPFCSHGTVFCVFEYNFLANRLLLFFLSHDLSIKILHKFDSSFSCIIDCLQRKNFFFVPQKLHFVPMTKRFLEENSCQYLIVKTDSCF